MPRLEFDDYLAHLRTESALLPGRAERLRPGRPGARLPGLDRGRPALAPDRGAVVLEHDRAHPAGAARATTCERPDRPSSYDDLLAAFDTCSAGLVDELERADPAETAWSWSAEQTVGFTFRRQAQEALIHRVDAEQTAGDRGVAPSTRRWPATGWTRPSTSCSGARRAWGVFHGLPHYVRFDITDTSEPIWVQLGRFVGTDPGRRQAARRGRHQRGRRPRRRGRRGRQRRRARRSTCGCGAAVTTPR